MAGTSSLIARIQQVGARATKGVSGVMREEAEAMSRLAASYAPRKTGALESAITFDEERDERNRLAFEVYIDLSTPSPEKSRPDRSVAAYAKLMHDRLKPYGRGKYNLGIGSLLKDRGTGTVGGKFMKRAFELQKYQLMYRVQQLVSREVTRSNR